MAIDTKGSHSSASHDSSLHRDISKDELLEQMHQDYIHRVTESGMPIWVLDMYSSLNFSVGENPPLDNQY
jgi:hypothetical protein